MTELISRYVKMGIILVLVWVAMWFWTSCGFKSVPGQDMSPTIGANQNCWMMWKERTLDHLGPGDIVMYDAKQPGQARSFLGRVVGLPGDRVRMEKGECIVNGQKVDGAYISQGGRSAETLEEIIVPRDTVYILMDNRKMGARYDSRGLGPVGVGAILAKAKK